MTEIEQLKQEIKYLIDDWRTETILDKIEIAYLLGRASVNTPARVAAARANGAKNTGTKSTGRPKGSGDKKPRNPGRWAHKMKENETEMKP